MKKILLIFIVILGSFFSYNVLAEWSTPWKKNTKVVVETTEKIPWAKCRQIDETWWVKIYECDVESWLGSVFEILKILIRYFWIIAGLAGVLFIVINGIMISMAWVDSSLKETAKDRMIKTIWGLVLLLMSGIILRILAPWVFS